jgi:hypothetical protein
MAYWPAKLPPSVVPLAHLPQLILRPPTRDPRLAQRAAEFALFSGQLKDAADALALWMELDPSSQIPANSCSSPCCVPASWQKASRW